MTTLMSLRNLVAIEGLKTARFDANLTLVATFDATGVYSVAGMTAAELVTALELEDASGEWGLMTDMQLAVHGLIAEAAEPETFTLDGDVASYRVSDELYLRATGRGYRWARTAA